MTQWRQKQPHLLELLGQSWQIMEMNSICNLENRFACMGAQVDNRMRAWYQKNMAVGLLYTCSLGEVQPSTGSFLTSLLASGLLDMMFC